ncbi:MAG TPA: MFS transporter [Acetobacteraceae bacterium]|nr:MFS transporter [Acetobacteraceae bacterium]
MPSTDANALPTTARQRRWSLAAAIASVTVFGLSVGQAGPLLSLLLEQRGTDATLNGLNAGATFIGVILGPLLAPRLVRRFGIRNFLLVCFGLDIALFLAMKPFDGLAAWFVLRPLGAAVGSSIFMAGEAWINQLAGDAGRGRIIGVYAAALSAGFGTGPLILSFTGIDGWPPFLANAAIAALATLPLFAVRGASRDFGQDRGAGPLRMFARAPLIVGTVAVFGLFESALMTLLPIWGVRSGLGERRAAATLSAIYFGSIILQVAIGWLSDRASRLVALRLCGAVGLVGALALIGVPATSLLLFGLLFVWGGLASGIYPIALSMAGDRFRGVELVSVNAAMIMAYGFGGLVGPPLGGAAMDLDNPRGLLWLFAALFIALLATSLLASPAAVRARCVE